MRFREDKLTEIVLRAINVHCKLLDAKMKKMKEESDSARSGEQMLRAECRTLRRQMEGVQAIKMRHYESYVAGRLCKENFLIKKREISAREEDLKIRLSVAERKREELSEKIKAGAMQMPADRKWVEYQEITELTPRLMKELVERIIVRPDGSVQIKWKFCDEIKGMVPLDNDIAPEEKNT